MIAAPAAVVSHCGWPVSAWNAYVSHAAHGGTGAAALRIGRFRAMARATVTAAARTNAGTSKAVSGKAAVPAPRATPVPATATSTAGRTQIGAALLVQGASTTRLAASPATTAPQVRVARSAEIPYAQASAVATARTAAVSLSSAAAAAQRLVHGQPGGLRAPGPPVGVPLGRAGPVLQAAAAGRGIAPRLPGNRRCRPTQLARDLADTDAPRMQDSDLLALAKRQISARYRGQADRPDPAAVAEPSRTDRWGHTSLNAGVLTRHSLGDRQPEPLPLLPPRHRRPARRPHRPPACSVQPTPLLLSHRNPRSPGVATTG